jgi:hypothetical protein
MHENYRAPVLVLEDLITCRTALLPWLAMRTPSIQGGWSRSGYRGIAPSRDASSPQAVEGLYRAYFGHDRVHIAYWLKCEVLNYDAKTPKMWTGAVGTDAVGPASSDARNAGARRGAEPLAVRGLNERLFAIRFL